MIHTGSRFCLKGYKSDIRCGINKDQFYQCPGYADVMAIHLQSLPLIWSYQRYNKCATPFIFKEQSSCTVLLFCINCNVKVNRYRICFTRIRWVMDFIRRKRPLVCSHCKLPWKNYFLYNRYVDHHCTNTCARYCHQKAGVQKQNRCLKDCSGIKTTTFKTPAKT